MTISLVSFNDHLINDGTTYVAVLTDTPFERSGQQVQVQPPGAWPHHIRVNQQPRAITVEVILQAGAVFTTRQRELAQWFAVGTTGVLVIDEDGTRKQLEATVVRSTPHARGSAVFVAQLVASDPRWRATNLLASAGVLTASGQGWTVTNPGNAIIDDPIITIRPYANKAAASGYLYRLESIVAWRAERPSGYYAVELTEGWDHATEVGAGRSQSDADDVRVLVDGIEVPRWIGENAVTDANSAATNIWANLSFSPRKTAVLLSALTLVSPGADGDLLVTKGGTLGWPRQGAILVDDEVITYTGRTESNADGNAAFTGVTRGARGTTVAAHSAAVTCYWIEHRVQIVYGNTGASAPDPRSDLKPLLDFTSSTLSNVRHEWLAFADSAYPGRSMQWLPRDRTFDDQYDKILAPTASPLTALTWEYQSGGAVAGKPIGNTYYRDFPTGTGGSGGNVASLTRVLADTLGMWVYGIDDAGQEVVLQKFAGALTSASANIAQPTNPVYRLECWAFNQVTAKREVANNVTVALTGTKTDMAQQFLVGAEPVELVGASVLVTDAVGGATVTISLCGDSATDTMSAVVLASGTYTTTNAGTQAAVVTFTTPFVVQPGRLYWLGVADDAATTSLMYNNGLQYSGGKARISAALVTGQQLDFVLLGRPAPTAGTLDRFDDTALADDGDQVTVDGVTVHLSSTETPYVALKARQSIYRFASGTLYNETTGQSVKINATCGVGADLVIDIAAGTAVNADDENLTSIMAGVEFSDPESRFVLAPGANNLRFVETGLAGVNVEVSAFAAWE